MQSKDFVISKIDELVFNFNNICCRYEHDEITFTHFIEVLPLILFESDEEFEAVQSSILESFYNEFPYESLCFISENSLIKITKPIYTRKSNHDSINFSSIELFEDIHDPQFYTDIVFDTDIDYISMGKINNDVSDISIHRTLNNNPTIKSNFSLDPLIVNDCNDVNIIDEESEYSPLNQAA